MNQKQMELEPGSAGTPVARDQHLESSVCPSYFMSVFALLCVSLAFKSHRIVAREVTGVRHEHWPFLPPAL